MELELLTSKDFLQLFPPGHLGLFTNRVVVSCKQWKDYRVVMCYTRRYVQILEIQYTNPVIVQVQQFSFLEHREHLLFLLLHLFIRKIQYSATCNISV